MVAEQLGVTTDNPRGERLPPTKAVVLPTHLVGDVVPDLARYLAWAAANAPDSTPAKFDPRKRSRRTIRRVGAEQK